jgi:hypothetical protein
VKAHDWTVLTLVPSGHEREVHTFEVKLGDVENVQLGWLDPNYWKADTSTSADTKVGESEYSLGLDLCTSGFLFGGSFAKASDLSVGKGDVIRCEKLHTTFTWHVNGTVVPNTPSLPENFSTQNYIPAFSGKGQWWITKVELSHP